MKWIKGMLASVGFVEHKNPITNAARKEKKRIGHRQFRMLNKQQKAYLKNQ